MEYKLWETSPIGSKTKYPPELVKLSFTISSGKCHQVKIVIVQVTPCLGLLSAGEYARKEHYFIYDGNALIADIGGYLSLLLGFSIFSIFRSFVESAAMGIFAKLRAVRGSNEKTSVKGQTNRRRQIIPRSSINGTWVV